MNREEAINILKGAIKKPILTMGIEALENQKTGHWINRHNIYANRTFDTKVCSECQYEYSYDAETGISNANFCPNCGAKMKGENKQSRCNSCQNNTDELSGECYECVKGIKDNYISELKGE